MRVLRGERVQLRPTTAADVPALRALRETPLVARWWGPLEPDWPRLDGDVAGASTPWTVVVEGKVAGYAQSAEETDPQYRHATMDLFMDPRVHNQGLGAEVVRTLARHLVEDRGHHRITIDPAAANAAAIRCYEKVGFRRVGVLRRYERNPDTGTWRDGLLLELLAEDLD
ncbi:MAG: GNAT family N-acetyltransferase [Motilibacteraceae bacterium]